VKTGRSTKPRGIWITQTNRGLCWTGRAFANARLHVDEFQHRGVGLAGVSPRGEFEVACTAVRRTPRLPQRFWQANAEISRHLAASQLQMAPVEAVSPSDHLRQVSACDLVPRGTGYENYCDGGCEECSRSQ